MEIYGIAELPLHYGKAPRWLFQRMVKLASEILEIMYNEFGELKIMERLSNPLWFQAFSNVLGFDWHSSGSTTVTCGVLREALNRVEINLALAGGKGRKSLETINDIKNISNKFGLNDEDVTKLEENSRLTAKVDNVALQDEFTIYHHAMLISKDGKWCVIQQGMNTDLKCARRYHWFSEDIRDMVEEPHKAISCQIKMERILNLIDRESANVRKTIVDIVNEGPSKIKRYLSEANRILCKIEGIDKWINRSTVTNRTMSDNRYVIYKPIDERKIDWSKLEEVYSVKVEDFKNLLLHPGIGPKTIRALSLISELIYNEPPSKRDPVTHIYDPVKWSYAVGGKDGIPYPISRKHYDEVIFELKSIVEAIKRDEEEKRMAFRNLKKISEKWGIEI
ncbi:MAG: DUF763 domain-containing protein [archaeon GBS-70-058]|mgnify:CR=1 FL=1|nr:DUF763 domain-containing protein [Candidatus Culexarchaeum nevadense]